MKDDLFSPRPLAGWYWVGAVVSLLFAAGACALYLLHVTADPATLPLDQRTVFAAEPSWVTSAFGLGALAELAAALLLCGAVQGRPMSEAAAVIERYPQVKENVRVARRQLSDRIRDEVDRVNAELDGNGRVLVRPSGTEPVVRVLAEAETDEAAAALCASISALVQQELG